MTAPTPRPPAGTVAVPQLALVMLSAALLAAVLVIALLSFQLGRETARANQVVENGSPEAPTVAGVVPRSQARVPPRPDIAAPLPRSAPPRPEPQPAPTVRRAPPRSSPALPPESAPQTSPTIDARIQTAVARYLDEVDAIATGSAGAGDPESLAMAMLGQATSGDWTQFDELRDTQRAMARRLRAVRSPPECGDCRAYHQQMLTLLDAGAGLLEEVRDGVQAGDIAALGTLATTAQRLRSDADSARRLGAAIQAKYGL